MFDFLFQDRNKEIQSLAEIIAVDMEKLNLSKLAIEKAIMMIAKAIAKSDILIQTESKEKNKKEYRLNVQPKYPLPSIHKKEWLVAIPHIR